MKDGAASSIDGLTQLAALNFNSAVTRSNQGRHHHHNRGNKMKDDMKLYLDLVNNRP